MEDLMIKIENVSKQYRLGAIGGGTLQGDIQSWWARKRGKEDPNSKIGAKTYAKNEKFLALDGVSFEVKKGERVGIIGHNGAGKSTLLKLLSRVTAPTTGEIGLNGRITSMLEVGTGFHGELTGRENIYMNGAILGMTRAEIDAKMEDIIEFSECRQFIDTPVKRYSSGMYVKLAFSVAAHLDSEIMIMDEVLAVGDMAFQKKCLDKMYDVSRTNGRTILYVSHNMNTIRQLCDRVIVLDHGKVVYDGEVEEGIQIYLGARRDISSGIKVFPEESHFRHTRRVISINELRICEHDKACFRSGECVRLNILLNVESECADVGIRFEISYRDGAMATTIFSDSFISLEKNNGLVNLELDTAHIPEGIYNCKIVAFQKDEFGHEALLDGVNDALIFEIVDDTTGHLIWDHFYWGHTKLHDLKVTI